MAQSKESKLWNDIKNLDNNWHFTRIESSTINGIPDVHCVVNRQVFWLELKANTSKNRPLLQGPIELLAVSRESRTPVPLRKSHDLRALILAAAGHPPLGRGA